MTRDFFVIPYIIPTHLEIKFHFEAAQFTNFVDVASAQINTRYGSIYSAFSHSIVRHTQDVLHAILSPNAKSISSRHASADQTS